MSDQNNSSHHEETELTRADILTLLGGTKWRKAKADWVPDLYAITVNQGIRNSTFEPCLMGEFLDQLIDDTYKHAFEAGYIECQSIAVIKARSLISDVENKMQLIRSRPNDYLSK